MFVVICYSSNRKLQYTCLFVKGFFIVSFAWVVQGCVKFFQNTELYLLLKPCLPQVIRPVPGLSMDCNLYLIHLFSHPLAPCRVYHTSSIQSRRHPIVGPAFLHMGPRSEVVIILVTKLIAV